MQFRGGSSKGLYLLASDLPEDEVARNQIILDAIGRDTSQVDGLGGGAPLTSKVAIIAPSNQPGVDVDYLFVQVVVGENRVDTKPNCGNILSGVGPFAIETGLVKASDGETKVVVRMLNSDKLCELIMQTPAGRVSYEGDTGIDGVLGTSAPILCNYFELAGSVTGALLPTGRQIDVVDEVEVTCIDNGMPVVLVRAVDLGIQGDERPEVLDENQELKCKLESIRLQIGPEMNLGDVDGAAVPKMCLISKPQQGGLINTRTFIPYMCHKSIGVLGAVSVTTACLLPNSVAGPLAVIADSEVQSVEHPAGQFSINLAIDDSEQPIVVRSAGVVRTVRLLSRGHLFVPDQANTQTN
jgi:4-oxalomesaconate tautomerase